MLPLRAENVRKLQWKQQLWIAHMQCMSALVTGSDVIVIRMRAGCQLPNKAACFQW
jgi:hypothetical protein